MVARHASEIDAKKKQLEDVAALLPDSADDELSAKLEPTLRYADGVGSDDSADFIAAETLTDLDASPKLNLHSPAFLDFLRRAAHPSDERDDDYEAIVTERLAHWPRYLIVYRTAALDPPKATGGTGYDGGTATVDAFVVDLDKMKVVASTTSPPRPDRSNTTAKATKRRRSRTRCW